MVSNLSDPTLLYELVNNLPLEDFNCWLQEVGTYIYLSVEADSLRTDAMPIRREKMIPLFTIIPDKPLKCLMRQQGHGIVRVDASVEYQDALNTIVMVTRKQNIE